MKEPINYWMGFAEEDLIVADLAFNNQIYNQACFHAQQCVEKLLKGLIQREGEILPRTHSLTDLLLLLKTDIIQEYSENIKELDGFHIPTRYPEALPGTLPEGLPSKEDAEEALTVAKKVFERIDKKMIKEKK